ncbi:MAG: class I SAM-dependent methyltransferase [Sulfurimonas sp.]|nr:class I SAM-dependent methyltransferase [Sulfurimonas sp.]
MIKKIKKIILKNFTKSYWKSNISNNWHAKRKDESFDDFYDFAQAISNKIEDLNFDTVIEIGTGAGTLISLLSKRLNTYDKFIGIDINKQQIDENKKNYQNLDNVEFIYMDIAKYINDTNLNNIAIVSQNTLDYFEKNELKKLFSLIHNKIKNVVIVVSSLKSNIELADSIDRKEADFKVYSHNYYALLKEAGYELMSIDSISDREVVVIAGYKLS